jgi:diaminohydroxyphosphoribosylaminopyrimidine deaminase/5-amino-6-(5-phosphoribosylamino)uracil reductase
MAHALMLARRGLGQVAPNPAVGCVVVADGRVIGRGWTQPGGRPHAETEALARAGGAVRGSTAYVTLEPCSHHGVTPPCAEALAAAGVARVVVAMTDPDERVNGRGVQMLREAGVEVVTGVLSDQAAALNRGFVLHRTANTEAGDDAGRAHRHPCIGREMDHRGRCAGAGAPAARQSRCDPDRRRHRPGR